MTSAVAITGTILLTGFSFLIGYTINNKALLKTKTKLKEKDNVIEKQNIKIIMKEEYLKEIINSAKLYESKDKIIELAKTAIRY